MLVNVLGYGNFGLLTQPVGSEATLST
jgi:hypothetical protein